MSRTDRHRPYHVQAADPYELRFYWHQTWPTATPTKTFWFRLVCPAGPNCSCRLVAYARTARADRRMRRHDDQRRARQALKGDLNVWDRRR